MTHAKLKNQHTAMAAAMFLAAAMSAGCWSQISKPAAPQLSDKPLTNALDETAAAAAKMHYEKWWLHFDDPQLNSLMDTAELENLSIQQAWLRYKQAQELAIQAGSSRFATLTTGSSAGRSVTKIGESTQTTSNSFSLSATAAYELDLWGRVSSLARATELDAMATEQQLKTAALSISAEIATTWYKLCGLSAELALLDQQVKTNRNMVEVISAQFENGQAAAADLLQQQQTLEASLGDRTLAAAEVKSTKNALAVLTGKDPLTFEPPVLPKSLPELTSQPLVPVASELITRRPDVQEALLAVEAADNRLAAAIAARFPQIGLNAQLSTSENRVSDLFENWMGTLAAQLSAPIIDGGQRRSVVRQRRAVSQQALAQYKLVALEAIEEVLNILASENSQRQYLVHTEKQLQLSENSLELLRDGYIGGNVEFDRLLNAQLSYQKLQRSSLIQQRTLINHRISLCRALAGDWVPAEPAETQSRVTGPAGGLLD